MIFLVSSKNKRQQSVNIYESCIFHNQIAMQRYYPVIKVLAAFIGKNASDDIATTT